MSIFNPPMGPNESVICRLSPGNFDAILKMCQAYKSITQTPYINIVNSCISSDLFNGNVLASMDLSHFFKSEVINLSFHRDHLKEVSKIDGFNDIQWIYDSTRKVYRIDNNQVKVEIPQGISNTSSISLPTIYDDEFLGKQVFIPKPTVVMGLKNNAPSTDIWVCKQQLAKAAFPNNQDYKFNYRTNYAFTHPDMIFRSQSFMLLGDKAQVVNIWFAYNGDYWLLSEVVIGLYMKVLLYEKLSPPPALPSLN